MRQETRAITEKVTTSDEATYTGIKQGGQTFCIPPEKNIQLSLTINYSYNLRQ